MASPLSSYQGGHVEFFKYMLELLRETGRRRVSRCLEAGAT